MATHYSKERAKYGSGTGTIIYWPVEYGNLDPTAEENIATLPAGYLKCDGSILKASDYPALAEILGVGPSSTFIRYDIEGEPIDDVATDEFILPDFGSKFAKPTTGASAGSYLNIVTRNQAGVEKRRSGMGIEASATAGTTTGNTTVIPVTYTGNFVVPSQEIAIKGKPSWTKGTNNSGYTDVESIDSLGLHSHMHFSTTNRLRIKTTNELTDPQVQGIGSRFVASTIPIASWLNATQYPTNQGAGTNQPPCWAIASGVQAGGYANNGVETNTGFEVNYYNMCYDAEGAAGLAAFRYYCLLTSATAFNLGNITFGQQPAFKSWGLGLGTCNQLNAGNIPATQNAPATYTTGAAGVPVDYNGASLSDVVPVNSNTGSRTVQVYPQVNNVLTEIEELEQPDGDPTVHSHKILLEKFDHTYKVKTNAYLLSPDNLQTTLTLKTDQVASLDSVTGPYIIMEYLIKY